MNNNKTSVKLRRTGAGQEGVVLIIALIVLVVMSMAGVLMLRSLGSGLGIAGNVSFKEGATLAADRGVENARAWLLNIANDKDTTLLTAKPGYYATANGGVATAGLEFDPLDSANFNWDAPNASVSLGEDNGNAMQYVIHRLCESEGSSTASGQQCVSSESETAFGSTGGSSGVSAPKQRVPNYRITTRVTGPRNTISVVQVIVY